MTKRKPIPPRSDAVVLTDLFSKVVTIEGRKMTMRQGMLLALSNQSLSGDMDASLELQKLRDECGIRDDAQQIGHLVVPGPLSAEEFDRLAFEQQAPYRERNYGKSEL